VRGTAAGQGGSHGRVEVGQGASAEEIRMGRRKRGRPACGSERWETVAPGEPCSDAELRTGVLIEALPQDYYYIHWRSTLPKLIC
jgi:hypothetical protein